MSREEDDHVRARRGEGAIEIFCERCGEIEAVAFPVAVDQMAMKTSAFIKKHQGCEDKGQATT